jgi:RNA recognition motif-containing protein
MDIYIGNLSYSVTEDDLKAMFGEFGEVSNATLIADRYTGKSKGFGFIAMPTQSQAEEAIKSLDGKALRGRNVKVNQARPRTERPQRTASYY